MNRPPKPGADHASRQAGQPNREPELEAQRAESQPDGTVRGTEGHDGGHDAKAGEGIDNRRDDVETEEEERDEGQVLMDRRGEEAGPPLASDPEPGQEPEADDGAQQHQADHASASGRVPEPLGSHAHQARRVTLRNLDVSVPSDSAPSLGPWTR